MAKPKTPTIVNVADAFQGEGKLKSVGGSNSDTFNNILANQVVKTLWLGNADEEERDKLMSASLGALIGIAPKDELEGMLAAQMVAAHNAAMECYRRAMIPEQTHEGRKESLNQANKLSRTYTTLLEALNRHRGKGQQKVSTFTRAVKPSWARSRPAVGRRADIQEASMSRHLPMHPGLSHLEDEGGEECI